MAQPMGLFSGVNPELIRQQEMEKRQGNNLALAQSSNPFASTMFTGLNLADELRNKASDVFGNPVADSPAVAAAKEEKQLEEEVARMVMEGRQAGKDNATIAQEVQQFLAGRGKFNKAEQYRTQMMAEEQKAQTTSADIALKAAQAAKALEEAGRAKEATAVRLRALKVKYPQASEEELSGFAADEKSFLSAMQGEKYETAEGVKQVLPGSLGEVNRGKAVERGTRVDISTGEKGNRAFVEAIGKELPNIETAIQTNNQFIGQLQQAKAKAIETAATKDRYTGGLAEATRFVASTLDSLGLLPPDQVDKLIKSDSFASDAANLLLTKTGGKIGAGFSNTDLETVRTSVGNALQNPRALIQVLSNLEKTTMKTNDYLKSQFERGRQSIEAGKPLPLDSSFNAPEAPKNIRELRLNKGTRDYEAYRNDPAYRAWADAKAKKNGQVVVLE